MNANRHNKHEHPESARTVSGLIIVLAALSFILLFLQSPASATEKEYSVTHDQVVKQFEIFLSSHDLYSDIPCRIYTKRMIDTVSSDKPIEIRIVSRVRTKLLKADNFQLVLTSGGKTIRRLDLRSNIGIEIPVAVTSKDLMRGDNIDGAYEIAWCDLSGTSVKMPAYENEVLGSRVVKINLSEGRIIDKGLLEEPDLIKRGDKVIVFFVNRGLSLTMIGTAMEDGKLGDRIRIQNDRSKKAILCEITGEGEVEIK